MGSHSAPSQRQSADGNVLSTVKEHNWCIEFTENNDEPIIAGDPVIIEAS